MDPTVGPGDPQVPQALGCDETAFPGGPTGPPRIPLDPGPNGPGRGADFCQKPRFLAGTGVPCPGPLGPGSRGVRGRGRQPPREDRFAHPQDPPTHPIPGDVRPGRDLVRPSRGPTGRHGPPMYLGHNGPRELRGLGPKLPWAQGSLGGHCPKFLYGGAPTTPCRGMPRPESK